jgi:hypothetical protein
MVFVKSAQNISHFKNPAMLVRNDASTKVILTDIYIYKSAKKRNEKVNVALDH